MCRPTVGDKVHKAFKDKGLCLGSNPPGWQLLLLTHTDLQRTDTDTEPEPVEQDVLCDDETVKSDSKSCYFFC